MDSKQQAQVRADQISAFQQELNLLHEHGVVSLTDAQSESINTYHDGLLADWSTRFDIDANESDKRLSIGMKITALFGAMALAISIFFLFYQFWGNFAPFSQSLILTVTPLLALLATAELMKKEASGYFAKIGAMITVACFVLNLSMLGQIYNLPASENAFLLWGALALLLAYLTHSRLLQAAAILFLAGYFSARMGAWFGGYWLSFGQRPETFFIPSLILIGVGHYSIQGYERFSAVYRVLGAILLLMPVLLLSNWGSGSYLMWANDTIESTYQVLGFVFSAMLIWLGVKRSWQDLVTTGTVFFVLFTYTKIFTWWWDWFPKYLFFLVIGLVSILGLVVFKRLRLGRAGQAKGVAHVG